jgi:carboxylesterase type B
MNNILRRKEPASFLLTHGLAPEKSSLRIPLPRVIRFLCTTTTLGAYHSAELAYTFNTIAIRDLTGEENEKVTQEMHTRWGNFIKSGDPNRGAALPSPIQWPQYDTAQSHVLFFDTEITAGALPDKDNLDFTAILLYDN